MKSFKQDDLVRFDTKWCEPSEVGKAYRIIECFDDVQRAKIVPVETTLSIVPVESVTYEMIEKI